MLIWVSILKQKEKKMSLQIIYDEIKKMDKKLNSMQKDIEILKDKINK